MRVGIQIFLALLVFGLMGCDDSNRAGAPMSVGGNSSSDIDLSFLEEDIFTEATLDYAQIGAFNLMRLTPTNKNFKRIVSLVDEAELHIFAGIEIMSVDAANALLDALNTHSDYRWAMALSKINNGESTYKEWFAYYYQPGVVKPIQSGAKFCNTSAATDRKNNTCYAKDYRVDGPDFARDPFVGHFQLGHARFTFISVHLFYGGHDQDSVRARLKEMGHLRKVADKVKETTPSHDVVLLGDFNLRLVEEVIWEASDFAERDTDARVKAEVPESFIDKEPHLNSLIVEATTVGNANYDHFFWFETNKYHVLEDSYGVLFDFDRSSTPQKEKYKSEVSDHFLIRSTFDLTN